MRTDIQKLDALFRGKPLSMRERIYLATLKDLLCNHPEQPFDDSFRRFSATHEKEQTRVLYKHLLSEFVDQHQETVPEGGVFYQTTPGNTEPEISNRLRAEPERRITHEVMVMYTQYQQGLVDIDFINGTMVDRARVILTTTRVEDAQELFDFYTLLDGNRIF